ncbi:MAG: phosphoethanolamine--lipid A transferase [Burkholderiaceae bacterium]
MTDSNARPAPVRRAGWNPLTLAMLGATWIATLGNWPLWLALSRLPEMSSIRGLVFIAGFAVMVAALTAALLGLFAWRYTIKPALAFFVLSAAVAAYFMGAYGIVLDPSMMTNVLQTDPREVGELLSWPLLVNLLALGLLPVAWLVRARVSAASWPRQALRTGVAIGACMTFVALLIFALFADLSTTMRNHRTLRYLINPVNAYFSLAVLAVQATAQPSLALQAIGLDARLAPRAPGARPPLVVLVVGETARADHFSLNGYARPTNPQLVREPDIVSFTDVTACGTSTAASLPCMFSAFDRRGYTARDRDHENLLDLAQRAGIAVLWLDNQSGCKGLCDRVPHAMTSERPAAAAPLPAGLCGDGECYDEVLLLDLGARLAALPQVQRDRGVLIVLHQMGSHGPAYYKRSPPQRKPFRPECETTVLQQCALGDVVNAYDNSIAYTDHVLAKTIRWLERHAEGHAPALVYVSDHGESLGENNLFLHGLPFAWAPREQTHVPMIAWLGADASATRRAELDCLRRRKDVPLSHDHLFHTVLGLLGIEASEYMAALDVFAPCRKS